MTLADVSDVAAIAGAIVALFGFPFLGWQLFLARSQRTDAIRLSTSQVLLAADAVLASHADVAAKLRPGGHGPPPATTPPMTSFRRWNLISGYSRESSLLIGPGK